MLRHRTAVKHSSKVLKLTGKVCFHCVRFAFILNSLAFDVRFPIRGDTPNRNATAKQSFEAKGQKVVL